MLPFITGLVFFTLFAVLFRKCLFTVGPNQRAVISRFGKAKRLPGPADDGSPKLEVIPPGGPYWCWPWETVRHVQMSVQLCNIAWDPSKDQESIEAVTKDNLSIAITGQIRWKVSEANIYAYVFGVKSPMEHVMGYFVSILRERIATFSAPLKDGDLPQVDEVSINALRKNLPALNQYMLEQCKESATRYGIELDAALIQQIDPPAKVDEALAAISTARNQVAADISSAQANADQEITRANRVVEITRNTVESEVAPLRALGSILKSIRKQGGVAALERYYANARLKLLRKAGTNITTL